MAFKKIDIELDQSLTCGPYKFELNISAKNNLGNHKVTEDVLEETYTIEGTDTILSGYT